MILPILGWCALGIGLLIIVVICSSFHAELECNYRSNTLSGTTSFSFIHPKVVSVNIAFGSSLYVLRLFGKTFGRTKKETAPPASSFSEFNKTFDWPEAAQKSTTNNVPSAEPELLHTETPVNHPQPPTEAPPSSSPEDTHQKFSSGTTSSPPINEPVDKKFEKRDNWFEQLKSNRYLFFLRNASWRGKMIRLIVRFIKSLFFLVRFDRAHLYIRAGVMDPMILGTISGYCTALSSLFSKDKCAPAFRFEPAFMTCTLEAEVSLRAGTSILTLITPLFFILCTFPYLHTLILYLQYRRKERQRLAPVVA